MKYCSKLACAVFSLLWLSGCDGGRKSESPVAAEAVGAVGAVTEFSDVEVRPNLSNGPLFYLDLQPEDARRGDTVRVTLEHVVVKSAENLVAMFQWFVNGILLRGETSDALNLDLVVSGDIVSVLVTLSDGSDVTEQSVDFQVADSVSVASVSGVQEPFYVGTEYVFYVEFFDEELQSPVATRLIAGPPGLIVEESGLVTYQPSVLLNSSETYNAIFQSADDQIVELTLNVVDQGHQPVLARSGLGVPKRHNSLYTNDFDGDGKTEIFTTDNRKKLYTIEQSDGLRSIDWVYPYSATGDIVHFSPFVGDLADFVIVTGTGVHVVPSRDSVPVTKYESTSTVVGATIGDFDQDGFTDVALLMENRQLEIVDSETWSVIHTIPTSKRDRPIQEITHGNVDDDDNLEIITGNGEVIDGSDGTLQWTHTSAFGAGIAVGDLDGDGVSEFIAGDRYRALTIYKPLSQTAVEINSEHRLSDACSPLLLNVDSDTDLELATGGCQSGNVILWDIENNSLLLKDEYAREGGGSSLYLSAGDIDQDGHKEIMWSYGTTSTSRDLLIVGSSVRLNDGSLPAPTSGHIPTLFGFALAGETTIAGKRSLAFTVDSAHTSDFWVEHQVAGSMGESGEFKFGSPIEFDVYNLTPGFLYDVNQDGSSDLIHIDDSAYLRFTDMNTLEPFEIYKTFNNGNPFLNTARPVTLSDNRTAALLSDSRDVVELYDLEYHVAVDTFLVEALDSAAAVALNGTDYVVGAGSKLTLWARSDVDSGYQPVNSIQRTCSELEAISRDDELYVLCIRNRNSTTVSLEIFDAELKQVVLQNLDSKVTAIEVVHGAKGDKIFVGTVDGHVYLFDGIQLNKIWQSPRLTGPVTGIHYQENADKVSLSISTTYAIYLSGN